MIFQTASADHKLHAAQHGPTTCPISIPPALTLLEFRGVLFCYIFIRMEYIFSKNILTSFSSPTPMMASSRYNCKRLFKQCHIMILGNCTISILETPDILHIIVLAQSERNYEIPLTNIVHENKVLNSFSAVLELSSNKSVVIIICSTAHRICTINIQYMLPTFHDSSITMHTLSLSLITFLNKFLIWKDICSTTRVAENHE
jgi:hypothetical protein